MGTIVAMAVIVDLCGQNSCCSVENMRGRKEFSRIENTRVRILYQIDVAKMGRNSAADEVA